MAATEFLPFATGGGANVDSQSNYAGSSYQTGGFTNGVAFPNQANKVWRQASMMAAALATLAVQILGVNVLDDGNLATLVTIMKNLLRTGRNALQVVAFSTNPVFDAGAADDFEITLTGNVAGSTLINTFVGQEITFIIHEDATGGRTFVAPAGLPLANLVTGANKTNVQKFKVATGGVLYPLTPLTVS